MATSGLLIQNAKCESLQPTQAATRGTISDMYSLWGSNKGPPA